MRPDMDADRDTRFWRLDTFSDVIFAVAMTLLVFTFPLAGLPQNLGPEAVQNLLQGLSGQFETFIISFLVGAFWTAHHRVFDKIKRYDQTLVWLNFVFLLFIVFVPFPTAVVVSAQSPGFPSRFMHQTSLAQGLRSLWCGCTRPTTFSSLAQAHRFAKSA
jgi:uncharacterized membrane protein